MKFDQELRIFFPQVKILSGIILLECSLKSQKKGLNKHTICWLLAWNKLKLSDLDQMFKSHHFYVSIL